MKKLFCLVALVQFVFDDGQGQITDTYICVPSALCPGGGGGINPRAGPVLRIVTPTGATTTTPSPAPNLSCPTGLVACTTFPTCGIPTVAPNTANGYATQGSFPWQAYLTDANGVYIGGGVLLDPYHVLTAAHKANSSGIRVFMGVYNPQTDLANNPLASIVQCNAVHENYNVTYLKNDIAILRLSTPIALGTGAITACLPPVVATSTSYVGATCVVAGWGQTNFTTFDAPTQTLKQAFVPIVDMNTCYASYTTVLGATGAANYLDTANEICAGGVVNIDACTKDGGSPLMCFDGTKFVVAGLVIWGKNCGAANVYGVYVSIPPYRNWIENKIRCLNSNTAANCYCV